MENTLYELAFLFFAYSFGGWIAETAVATIKNRDFRNRGFLSGPFCLIYGFSAIVVTVMLRDLTSSPAALFLGSTIITTAIEWITGLLLERMDQKRWWDYSKKKWNFDGYICLQYSILWGILSCAAVYFGNQAILFVYHLLPHWAEVLLVWGLTAVTASDLLVSFLSVRHLGPFLSRLLHWNRKVEAVTLRLGSWISGHIETRISRSYPEMRKQRTKSKAERIDLTELFWLFLIGAFLGDLTETVFCRLTAGVWMSRSSLVWGPFSIVWGFAIALATALLYRDREKPDRYLFYVGTFLGGAYEYLCSVTTEILFGKVFWDYSDIPFNLGGRINLLYCFFWGIAAVVWIKMLYPKAAKLIQLIRRKTGKWLTAAAVLFMVINVIVSVMALVRYDTRGTGKPAQYEWEKQMDAHFGDERMQRIYPNAIDTDNSGSDASEIPDDSSPGSHTD